MTAFEKRMMLHSYCGKANCNESCKLVGIWDHPCSMNDSECLQIDLASEEELNKALTLIGANCSDDPVNHPAHYTKGKIEVADFIADQKLNFDRGNAVKYVCRAGSKDPEKEIQDLEKAIWYINHEIKMLKGETNNGTEKET